MRKGLWRILVALMIAALAASACAPAAPAPAKPAEKAAEAPKPAEKAEAPKAAEKPAEAPKPAADRPPIKIGFVVALTGPFGQAGKEMRQGFQLYLDQKGGSIAGRKIELLVEDDEGKPDVGLTKVKKLVERDQVHLITGFNNSTVALAIAEYAKAQKVPVLFTMAGADDLTQRLYSPYFFRNGYGDSQAALPFGDWAYKKGYRKAAIFAPDYAAGHEFAGGFARAFTQAGGSVIQELYPPLGTPDPAPFITTIKTDADVLYAWQAGADSLRFLPTYEKYGLKGKIPVLGHISLVDEGILPQIGDSAVGTVASGPWTRSLNIPANKKFVADYEAKYKEMAKLGSALSYDAAVIIGKALEATSANVENKEALIAALEKTDIKDSPRGPIKFDKNHNVILDLFISEIRKVDGKSVAVVIDTMKEVSQFWKWTPSEYMKMPSYPDMKGKWAK